MVSGFKSMGMLLVALEERPLVSEDVVTEVMVLGSGPASSIYFLYTTRDSRRAL